MIDIPPLARRGLAWGLAVLILDQITKQWIVASVMNPPRFIEVTSFFNIVMVWNRGISFGMFNSGADWNSWAMPALALLITAGLLLLLWRTESRLLTVALGLVIGGALSNVVDRLRYGAVADFLDFHWADWHWPAFNVADAAISLGALAFLAESLFAGPEKPKTKP